jgi:cytochrome c-type biogenesis protein CcmE
MSKWMYVVGVVLLAGFAVLMAMELKNASTPYVTKVADIQSFGNRAIQFKGSILHEKMDYDGGSTKDLRFTLKDDAGKTLDVSYDGPKPGNFDTADTAVVLGAYKNGKFRAEQLSLKCPSKYQGKE